MTRWRSSISLNVWAHERRERLACLDSVLVQFPQMAYASFGIAMLHVARDGYRERILSNRDINEAAA